ncbi:hypothetical protein BDD12DRAFT_941351 [Trichophaea hybrida]|nr:hypothetical protein BDD12DRAFT_941351 [Trichophaea hybrida]
MGTCTSMDASAKQGMWYMTQGISNPAEGYRRFIACQACFEDVILASPFHQFFEPLEAAVTDETTTCHVSWPFAEALLLNTLSPTWDEIHRKIDHMLLKVPECLGDKLIKDPGRQWWKPKDTVLPLYVCDCCYWDGIIPTLFSSEFVAIQDPKDALCCVMSRYQLSTVWQYAEEKEDITPWLDAANAALSPHVHVSWITGQNLERIHRPRA